ncbi:MAG: MFS transporter [Asgard group archaeon]|nr:MFS transporter [Asgard group archaeon]
MSSYKETFRDFPVRQMVIICLIRFSEPLAFTSIFPYIYFMIRDFQISPTEQEISKYSGYIASSFAFCQFLFAVKWGKLLDKIGRKSILLMGLFGTSLSLLLFGFSQNYYWALLARSLAGVLNGNVAVLRTMIGEIATEKRHQPYAFMTMPLLFNFGAIIGPAIGGSPWLTRPSKKNPYQNQHNDTIITNGIIEDFYEKFITRFPYALSNVVVALFLWFSLICGFLFLEETHDVYKYRKDYGVELGDWLLSKIGIKSPIRPWNATNLAITPIDEHQHLLPDETTALLETAEAEDVFPEAEPELEVASIHSDEDIERQQEDRQQQPTLLRVQTYSNAFTPKVIGVITGNFIISLHSVTYNEFLPVFLASRFQPDQLQFPFLITGGLGLDTSYIGTLFSSTGIMGMLIVLVLFPLITSKLGTVKGYRLSVSIFPIVYFLVPFAIFTKHDYNSNFPTWFTPILLYCLTSLKTLASSTGMPQVTILNHRAAEKKYRAYVNSSAMSIISLSRFCGPIVFGYLMSIGDKYQIGWLIWWIMSGLALIGMIQSYWIDEDDDDE